MRSPSRISRRTRTTVAVAVATAMIGLAFGVITLGTGDDESTLDTDPADTSTSETTTTTAPTTSSSTTSTTAPGTEEARAAAVFPDPTGGVTYDDPTEAARAFAQGMVGVPEPVVGEMRQGDARSGEVPVHPVEGGPESTVLVRQFGDHWYVIGAVTESIVLEAPENGGDGTPPLTLRGQATAFEGHVEVDIHADGAGLVSEGFVTGSGDGTLGPFEETFDFAVPGGAAHGVVILHSEGGPTLAPWAFTAVRVQYR